jgi:hypothetical protein
MHGTYTKGDTKVLSDKSLTMTKGGSSGDSRGGSSRSYPKGKSKPGNTESMLDPTKVPATDKYVGGV